MHLCYASWPVKNKAALQCIPFFRCVAKNGKFALKGLAMHCCAQPMDADMHFCKSLQHSSDHRLFRCPVDSFEKSNFSNFSVLEERYCKKLLTIYFAGFPEKGTSPSEHEKEAQAAVMSQCVAGRQSRLGLG